MPLHIRIRQANSKAECRFFCAMLILALPGIAKHFLTSRFSRMCPPLCGVENTPSMNRRQRGYSDFFRFIMMLCGLNRHWLPYVVHHSYFAPV